MKITSTKIIFTTYKIITNIKKTVEKQISPFSSIEALVNKTLISFNKKKKKIRLLRFY